MSFAERIQPLAEDKTTSLTTLFSGKPRMQMQGDYIPHSSEPLGKYICEDDDTYRAPYQWVDHYNV